MRTEALPGDEQVKAYVFDLVARPNPVLAPRHIYEAKVARWQRQWPALTVLPWPDSAAG